jgi:glycosyltransferase involved in cell wall biosynthesis
VSLLASPAPAAMPILSAPPIDLTVFIASLARGGAERLVVRWLARLDPALHRVRLVVMRGALAEYPVPAHVRVERLASDRRARLAAIGRSLRGGRPVLCHLLSDDDLATLWAEGVATIPVIHNDRPGWVNTPGRFPPSGVPLVIAVSGAVASAVRASGWRGHVAVIRAPAVALPRSSDVAVRATLRAHLGIADDELLVVMVGGVKPQKAYPRAVRVLAAIRAVRPARLAIVGGPVGRDGLVASAALTAQIARLGLSEHVLTPGFVDDVGGWLAAADVFLNTSAFEGLSLATQEALAAGLPVVATDVGGQREIESARLRLVPAETPPETIGAAVLGAPPRCLPLGNGAEVSAVSCLAMLRLWTGFATWPERRALRREVLFVTANLNAGGAQRSLVHVVTALVRRLPLAVAAINGTTQAAFATRLDAAGVPLFRPAADGNPFTVAEALAARGVPGVVCFWNADPRLKLLLVTLWGGLPVRFVDVSPGPHAWRELAAVGEFARAIAFDAAAYYRRLDRLVLKYHASRGERPAERRGRRPAVIPNGIDPDRPLKFDYRLGTPPRIVVAGRIAPMKRVELALAAMPHLWREFPEAELHLFGVAEPRDAAYLHRLFVMLGESTGPRVRWHGAGTELAWRLPGFDAALVLGDDQGCPNWGLEALAAGLPTVANASGGTAEQVVDGRTGLLLPRDPTPSHVAAALTRLLSDRRLAERVGRRGARHVRRRFALARVVARYERLLRRLLTRRPVARP